MRDKKVLPPLPELSSDSISVDVSPLYHQHQQAVDYGGSTRPQEPMLAPNVRERVLQGHINQTFL